jgi:hypothetical protein
MCLVVQKTKLSAAKSDMSPEMADEAKVKAKWALHAQHDLTVANISSYDYNAHMILILKSGKNDERH